MRGRKLTRPKKFKSSSPGLLHPKDWAELVDYLTELEKVVISNSPKSSGDVLMRPGAGGFTAHLARRGGGGGGGAPATYPFEIYDTGTAFVSRAGVFNGARDELTQAATTDGTWRLYASLTINATTGEITASSVAWYASAQTSTTTTFYHLIGIGIVADSGETRTVINYNYGPIFFLLHGSVIGDWNCSFY